MNGDQQHGAGVLRWSGGCHDALRHGMIRSIAAWWVIEQGPGTGREAGFPKSGDSVYQVELGGAGGLARRGRTVEVVGVVDSIGWVGGAAWFRAGTG
jgi:hypothetical protein